MAPAGITGSGDNYALEVIGNLRIDAGILDDDTVIIRRDDATKNGAIVVSVDRQAYCAFGIGCADTVMIPLCALMKVGVFSKPVCT